jgi:urease accessory protein
MKAIGGVRNMRKAHGAATLLGATVVILLGGAVAAPALAHPGHVAGGLGAGAAHPFLGLDHLLAMVAVGLWAVRAEGAGPVLWRLPAGFLAAMAAGMAGLSVPGMESGMALSVIALGLAVALALRSGTAAALAVVAAFGVAHGVAHGAEMPAAAAPLAYAAGVLLGTAALHGIGLGLGLSLRRLAGGTMARAGGLTIAALGALLVATG